MLLKGFKTKLNPNNKQRSLFAQHAGCARWAYNWGLKECFQAIEARNVAKEKGETLPKFPSAIDLHKKLNAEVKPENKWFYNSSKCAPQQALRDLDNAWKRHLKGDVSADRGFCPPNRRVKGSGVPKRKKKFINDHFYLDGTIYIKDNFIQLPRIGLVRLHETVANQKIKSVTISRKAGEWYVAFKIKVDQVFTDKGFGRVGVDLGIKVLATVSDGTVYPALKPYRSNKVKLKVLQRQLARQIPGGKNREKTKQKIAKLHDRIASIRNDATHKLTSHLTKNHGEIVIENLNVSGMLKNHKLASAIADSGFYEFRRQLEYKAEWYGSKVIVIDRFYPSSQLCSSCGHRQPMPLHLRTYDCPNCGISVDRDLNASMNIRDYSETAASSAVEACGRDLPGGPIETGNKPHLGALSKIV
ncbi:RNA-guided endonuclease InsQ/TnpB family protein [Tolypothrix sp. VBCCA 56010]|uniref:RNA-guided endonuclease InsQ/TnpB family protein n=1 Tax=Tolypothrix sp. VBCCA 56010 TaxID=3137731 RepID=UPI003D7CC036